jgi:O-antigen ligase
MATGALAALCGLGAAIRRARATGDIDASTALVLGMGGLVSLPNAVVAFSGSLHYSPDVFGNIVKTYPAWYPRATAVALLSLAALTAVLILRRLRSPHVYVCAAGLLAIVVWAVAQLASGLHSGPLLSPRTGLILLCLLAATILPRGRGACLGAGIYGVALAIVSALLTVAHYNLAFVEPNMRHGAQCQGACHVLSFQGILANENSLGMSLALTIPFAYLGFRGRARYGFIAYLGAMVIATGSRTATVAALVSMLALVMVRPRLDADRSLPIRSGVAAVVLMAAVIGSADIVLHNWSPSALTDRGALWQLAARYIHQSPWLGYGPEKWSSLYSVSQIPLSGQYSPHNQWLDVLFTAGWVGLIIFVSMGAAMLWSAASARPAVMIALATVALLGTAERPWAVGTLDEFSFSLVALILSGATSRPRDSPAAVRSPQRMQPAWAAVGD